MRTARWAVAAIIAMIAPPVLPATSSLSAEKQGTNAALRADGTILTWGTGPIGDGTSNPSTYPKQVFTNAIAVSAGWAHVLALRYDGSVRAWGLNPNGQLGDGTVVDRLSPVVVHVLTDIVAVSAGHCHSLALDKNGNVSAWGDNTYGSIGDGTTGGNKTLPVSVSALTGVVAIAAGGCVSAALKSDGTVWAWGQNYAGQLGDGTTTQRSAPVRVSGLTGVRAIANSGIHMLALKNDGTVWAWGSDFFGETGDPTFTSHNVTPVQVSGLTNVVGISVGAQTSYAVTADGSVWAWGDGSHGNLGNGALGSLSPTPARVRNLSSVSVVSGGDDDALALKTDGSVWMWGNGVLTPTAVAGEGGSGTLDLGTATSIQAAAPVVSGFNANNGSTFVSVTAVATFRAQDVGKHIYLFAYAPSSLVKSAKDGPCVLASLTPTGLHSVSSSSALTSTQNVSSANQQTITLLNTISTSTVAGASLCIGVGSTATEATSPGQYTCPAVVPGNGGTVCEPPETIAPPPPPPPLAPTGVVAKTLGSRATVSSGATLFGGFELSGAATVYILVRGNSLGTLGITQNYLDAPRVRLYNAQGQDLISDGNGPGFNGCSSGAFSGAAVVAYYTDVRGVPAHPRDGCTAQSLAAGAYTFTVTPSTAGTTSLPSSGQVLFEVTLGAGSGTITKTLGSRATVTSSATLYGGFEIGSTSDVYILVRGNSLGTLGITQSYLDAPRVRLFNAAGQDLIISSPSSGPSGLGFNACDASISSQLPVLTYYATVRGVPAAFRDGCIAQNLSPGAYTFSVTPSIPGVTSLNALSAPSSGQVLFEVTLQ